jgi:hypothetical protein
MLIPHMPCHAHAALYRGLEKSLSERHDGFSGLVVSMLASGTQDRGLKSGRSRRIFQGEKSKACLPSEGK